MSACQHLVDVILYQMTDEALARFSPGRGRISWPQDYEKVHERQVDACLGHNWLDGDMHAEAMRILDEEFADGNLSPTRLHPSTSVGDIILLTWNDCLPQAWVVAPLGFGRVRWRQSLTWEEIHARVTA